MIVFPNAKINLGLSVLRKRADGFHEIETVMYPVPLHDVLEFLPSEKFSLTVYGQEIPGKTKENILYRAWELLSQNHQISPVEVRLLKTIPPGSGLGGGSSDAAFFLKALNDYFNLSLDIARLREYAGLLGSDCPFFIENTASLATGKGENLQHIRHVLQGKFIVIVFPGIHIDTKEAYNNITAHIPEHYPGEIIMQPVTQWRNVLQNDFEYYAFKKYPVLQKIKSTLYDQGAVYASLTGSGSAIYAIFDRPIRLKDKFPEFFVRGGFLQ